MDSIRVKIKIAGRIYPLTIDPEEEKAVRDAGKEINRLIDDFEKRYAVTDRQDAIAMAALQIASKKRMNSKSESIHQEELDDKLIHLTNLIEREIEKIK